MRMIHQILIAVSFISLVSACMTFEPSSTEAPTQPLPPFHTGTPFSIPHQDLSTPIRLTTPHPSPTPLVHLIQAGDTLLGISIRYGVSLEDLLIANPGVDPGFLSIGQEITIPGPEGEPVGVLLPSPTPMVVEIGRSECFRTAPVDLLCITAIRNDTTVLIEGIAVSFEIIDAGLVVGQYEVFGPLNLLAPGTSMPFMIRIGGWEGDVPSVKINVLSGVRVEDPGDRYASVSVDGLQENISDGGAYAELSGEVLLEEPSEFPVHRVRVLGVAKDSSGFPVGYAVWEEEIIGDFSRVFFDVTVFSIGTPIITTDVFVEAQGLDLK